MMMTIWPASPTSSPVPESGTTEIVSRGEHLPSAGPLDIALELFADRQAPEGRVLNLAVRRLRGQLHLKRTTGVHGHGLLGVSSRNGARRLLWRLL